MGASYWQYYLFALQTVTKVYTVIGNLTKYVSLFPPRGNNNSCYLESQHKLSSFMCVCTNLCSFLPVTYFLNCKCGLLGTSCTIHTMLQGHSWWLNLFSVPQYISIFGQLSHIIPTFKKMVSWCHWAMLSTASSTIDHLQVEMVGTHLSQQVYSLVNYVQVRWSTPPSCHKVFVGYFPRGHSLWKVTWLYVLWGFICWQIYNLSWEPKW